MYEITGKLQLLFEFFEIRKSKHSRSYVSLFIMRKNKNEQDLARKGMLDLTLVSRQPSNDGNGIFACIRVPSVNVALYLVFFV